MARTTFAPETLKTLRAYLIAHGLPGAKLGIVGNAAHVRGGESYHLGRRELKPGAYSAKTRRDRDGLTDAASALDIGTASLAELQRLSKYLLDQARTNAPGTRDWRELIYSPDGQTVMRWDRERGFASKPEPGEADASHLTHTHLSWYRDAEARDHIEPFRAYYEPEAAVDVFSSPGSFSGVWPKDTPVYAGPTGGAAVARLAKPTRLLVAGQSDPTTKPARYLVDGAGLEAPARMAWLPRDLMAVGTVQDETYDAGVAAAVKAAGTAARP